MFRSLSRKRRFGFTLVEVLVTTVVVGVMAAVVIPAMVKQATAGDAPRVASDLGSVKSAIEVFSQNVRPRMPGDVEDLINKVEETEMGLDGTVYTAANLARWTGPYIEWTATAITNAATGAVIFSSGGSAEIHNALFRCPQTETATTYSGADDDAPCTLFSTDNTTNVAAGTYGAVKVSGIGFESNEFLNLNAIIDGQNEGTTTTTKQDQGLLRQNASGTVFFLAVPFNAP